MSQIALATQLLHAGHEAEAEAICREDMARNASSPEVQFEWGRWLLGRAKYSDAQSALARAAELAPANPILHATLAQAASALGDKTGAIGHLQRALAIAPNQGKVLNNLGLELLAVERRDEAIDMLRRAVQQRPGHAPTQLNLATALQRDGQIESAVKCIEQVLGQEPENWQAHFHLGRLLARSGHVDDAIASLRAAIGHAPRQAEIHTELGDCLMLRQQWDEARRCFERAVDIRPAAVAPRLALARLLVMSNQTSLAVEHYRRVLKLQPHTRAALLGESLSLPVIQPSVAAIESTRRRFQEGLDRLRQCAPEAASQDKEDVLAALQRTNFHLAYLGVDDLPLQRAYGEIVGRWLKAVVPDLMSLAGRRPEASQVAPGRRIRLGFVSSFFSNCTVGHYFKSWVLDIDRSRFEIHVFDLGSRCDALNRQIAEGSEHYLALRGSIEDMARRLRDADVDILIYPELGMAPTAFLLAAMRLAPIQCAAWGHPVTSGLENIDCFISCQAMEPPAAQRNYCEQLLLLPGLGTCFEQPAPVPARERREFGLPDERNLYLVPHALFKIHPDDDRVFAGILAQDPNARLVLFADRHAGVTAACLERIGRHLAEHGVDPAERLLMLPCMNHADFLAVVGLCDVQIDCLHWSGGRASLDAVACGLPLVTLPGATMRSRQTAGMLTIMAMEELIASDADDLVRIAVALAQAPQQRARIRARLDAGRHLLFGQKAPIEALQGILRDLARPAAIAANHP